MRRLVLFLLLLTSVDTLFSQPAVPPPVSDTTFAALRWRGIGPFRGGRTKAGTGVPGRPGLFYIGVVNGGVWRSNDYGRTWVPIFDDQPTGSIGAIAVAPSNPDVIYVGSGEGMQRPDLSTGDGLYKSTDAGRTWTHLGLRDAQQITQIVVHPRDADTLYVAALGHPYGANEERGVFKSVDGGRTFQRVLYKDPDTGAADLAMDPADPDVLYAVLWEARQGPWENAAFSGPGSGLFKSTDAGATWRQLTTGLPTFADGLTRIGITVAPSLPSRLFATVGAGEKSGIYRSDDAGDTWTRVNADPRVVARPDDAADVRVHPTNPDVVFVPTIVAWKSVDGGRTFTGWRGAPGGDDYQRIWIDPDRPDTMLMTADQGAIVTVNGGETWSSWYNQPTAQFYHVSTDNAFPYRVCGGQQESGSACVRSRGDHGQITFRDWAPVGVEEYGYVAADPRDPDIVYGGKVTRFDRRTGQVQNVSPRPLHGGDYRVVRTQPVLFSPTDPQTLYFSSNVVWRTRDGGRHWEPISPDLTRKTWEVPANVGTYRGMPAAQVSQRGVVYTIAPSPVDASTIWAGTDDGLVHVTRDGGKTWQDVTPPQLTAWSKVSLIDASSFDAGTAYAAINTFRLDDTRPHILRTRDGGKTWTRIVAGIPDNEGIVNAVREDPKRRGLLFAGTERQVWMSFDDGERWQSLRNNMPATSVRDLVVKDDDLVAGTHGRGFWILDDITPLRQVTPEVFAADAYLFEPQQAWRVRWNMNTDTPLPPDEPAGQNPPDGAIIHYWLKADAAGPVTLEIVDGYGAVVRRYSTADPPEPPVQGRNIPDYWIRPFQALPRTAGLHRFVWDVHHAPPEVQQYSYPIAAIAGNTPRVPRGRWALPGRYTVRLAVGGRTLTQPLVVKMDPRVTAPQADLATQHRVSGLLTDAIARAAAAQREVEHLSARIDNWSAGLAADAPGRADAARLRNSLAPFRGGDDGFSRLIAQLAQAFALVEGADAAPTDATERATLPLLKRLEAQLERWPATRDGAAAALAGGVAR
jgi:photosystem II stability/assembly factor-like uncharacterized protein